MSGNLSSGGKNPGVFGIRTCAAVTFGCVFLLSLAAVLPAGAVNGTCNVAESWVVTIQEGLTPPVTYRGRESGTLIVNNNQYTPLDHTGIPGGDTNLHVRTISGSGPYSVLGEYPYQGSGLGTNGFIAVIHLTYFSIGIPRATPLDGPINSSKSSVFSATGTTLTGLTGSGTQDNGDHYFFTAQSSSGLTQIGPPPAPAPFFQGQAFLGNNFYYLGLTNGNVFGYYAMTYFPYVYHFDMGWEYFIDAGNSARGCYLYDFTSSAWLYTDPNVFPNLYDFKLNSWVYYFPNDASPGHYTSNPRSFYNYNAKTFITDL